MARSRSETELFGGEKLTRYSHTEQKLLDASQRKSLNRSYGATPDGNVSSNKLIKQGDSVVDAVMMSPIDLED